MRTVLSIRLPPFPTIDNRWAMHKMKLFSAFLGLVWVTSASAYIPDETNEIVTCRNVDVEGEPSLRLKAHFDTEDLRGVATLWLQGDALYEGMGKSKERCQAFTVRGKVFFNTFTIHTMGCDLWACSLHTPDTIHGEALSEFGAKLHCFDPSFKTSRKKRLDLVCSTSFEPALARK